MKACAGAWMSVGLCGCLGPHPQSVPAVESGVRARAGWRFLFCACLISFRRIIIFEETDVVFDEDTRTWPTA